ncbi:hypothetical protein [Desulfogranum mediterraneum]|uniref:hypothetical protein n=1 Tax=Desulfogranum mediterraneum TaxID=160661 RepID=UPI001294696B|nr:hypothetical protein [Desulfogranum mediterraneum]
METSVHRSYLQLVSSFCQEPFPLEPDAASLLARGKKILKASFSFSRDQTLQLEQIVSLLEQSPDKDRQALCTSLATVIPKDDWMLIPVQGKEGLSR